jgi:hypothetical protein
MVLFGDFAAHRQDLDTLTTQLFFCMNPPISPLPFKLYQHLQPWAYLGLRKEV